MRVTSRSTLRTASMVKKLTIKLTMNKKMWSELVARWNQMTAAQTTMVKMRWLQCR